MIGTSMDLTREVEVRARAGRCEGGPPNGVARSIAFAPPGVVGVEES